MDISFSSVSPDENLCFEFSLKGELISRFPDVEEVWIVREIIGGKKLRRQYVTHRNEYRCIAILVNHNQPSISLSTRCVCVCVCIFFIYYTYLELYFLYRATRLERNVKFSRVVNRFAASKISFDKLFHNDPVI